MNKVLFMKTMLTYLTRRQGLGLLQNIGKQINEDYSYWEDDLWPAIAVIGTLAERGMAL